MLAHNPNSETGGINDQLILSQVVALSKQAWLFYQRVAPYMVDNNIRRHFVELAVLHQQAEKIAADEQPKLSDAPQNTIICQWYQRNNAEHPDKKVNWLAELPEQLRRQLAVFKRYSRQLEQPANAKAMANLTAGLQIVVDQLNPLLTDK